MKNFWSGILYGVVFVFILITLFSTLFALLLRFTGLTENTIKIASILISYILLFIGGMLSGLKVKQRGIVVGLLTGLLFSSLVLAVRYLGYDSLFDLKQTIAHIGYVAAATIGGILGVNKASNDFS